MYDKEGNLLPQPKILTFGNMLYNADEVEKTLRRAQDALLHLPYLDEHEAEIFLQGDYDTMEDAIGFSRNVVRLEVWGPELVDVTFIDLPGIISNASQVRSSDS